MKCLNHGRALGCYRNVPHESLRNFRLLFEEESPLLSATASEARPWPDLPSLSGEYLRWHFAAVSPSVGEVPATQQIYRFCAATGSSGKSPTRYRDHL